MHHPYLYICDFQHRGVSSFRTWKPFNSLISFPNNTHHVSLSWLWALFTFWLPGFGPAIHRQPAKWDYTNHGPTSERVRLVSHCLSSKQMRWWKNPIINVTTPSPPYRFFPPYRFAGQPECNIIPRQKHTRNTTSKTTPLKHHTITPTLNRLKHNLQNTTETQPKKQHITTTPLLKHHSRNTTTKTPPPKHHDHKHYRH